MRVILKCLLGLLALALVLAIWLGFRTYQEIGKRNSEDPLVWQSDISAFEAEARRVLPPENAVVFVGSSSIRFWDSLVEDMAPIPVIQRGFGGAKLNDLVYYAERIVNVYQPAAVVVFAGSNDITKSDVKTPMQLLNSYQQFVARVRTDNAELPVYYIAITPSPRRWEVWADAQAVNAVIKDYSERTSGLFYIDTGPVLLNAEDVPDIDYYKFDKVHLSEKGYRQWTSVIRPRLLKDFPQY